MFLQKIFLKFKVRSKQMRFSYGNRNYIAVKCFTILLGKSKK